MFNIIVTIFKQNDLFFYFNFNYKLHFVIIRYNKNECY